MAAPLSPEILFVRLCIQCSSISVVWYDYLLTFQMEMKYIWGQRFRVSTAFYCLCRFSLIVNVVYLFKLLEKLGDPARVEKIFLLVDISSVLARGAIVATLTMRTYAMWNRNKFVLAILVALGSGSVIVDFLDLQGIEYPNPSTPLLISQLLGWFMLIFETISSFLTALRAYMAYRVAANTRSRHNGLAFLMLKEGVLYYVVMTVLTSLAIMTSYVNNGFLHRMLSAFLLPISGLLTARFLLHLRSWDSEQAEKERANDESRTMTMAQQFTTVFSMEEFGVDPVREQRQLAENERETDPERIYTTS